MKKIEVNIEAELMNIKIEEVQNFDSDFSEKVLSKLGNHKSINRKRLTGITSLMILLVFFNVFSMFVFTPKKKAPVDYERYEKINLIIDTFSLDK